MSARQMRRARERQVRREERRTELRRKTKIAGAAGAAIGATALFAPAAQAATFTVNSLEDPGDGTCDAAECTLREAIVEANDAPGADTIVFATGLSGTINLDGDDIEIYDGNASDDAGGLDIQGPGPGVITVDAGYNSRIFDIGGFYQQGTPVRIGGLKLRAGESTRDGGAIRNWGYGQPGWSASLTVDNTVIADSYAEDNGGGIFHQEERTLDSLTITNSRIVDNRAGHYGGGVFSEGATVTISGSQINDNVAEGAGGGVSIKYAYGSETQPAVTITGSEVNNNRVLSLYSYNDPDFALGGGASFGRITGEVLIERSTFAYNEADPDGDADGALGGGIFGHEVFETTISESTIANNTSSKYGGGLALYETGGSLVQNTTISGNEAAENGGGVWLDDFKYSRFENSTITDNDAWATANGSSGYGGGIYAGFNDDPVEVSSTIVAENNDRYDESPDLAGGATFELDFSLIGDVGGATYTDNGGNILGGEPGDPPEPPIDPLLAPLSDNGGPTLTHLPLAGSPALDAGISNGLTTDQRGLPRTVDLPEVANAAGSDATDIGSVEVQGQPQQPPQPQPGATGECKGSQVPLISGTGAGEELVGTPGRDLIRGGGGKDQIDGLEADDCLFGEAEGDIVNGDSGDDLVDGGDGDDILSGVQGSDQVHGGAGVDRVKGNAGDDTVTGGAERDVLAGGGGQDNLRGQGGDDKLRGAEASDTLRGGGGADKLKGAGGDDTLRGGGGDDRINCGAGDDVVKGAGPGDTVAANCETVN